MHKCACTHKFSSMLSQTIHLSKHGPGRNFQQQLLYTEKGICPVITFHLRARSVKYKSYASESPIPISSKLFSPPLQGRCKEEEKEGTVCRKSVKPSGFLSFFLVKIYQTKISTYLECFPQRSYIQDSDLDKENSPFIVSLIQSRKILTLE